MTLTLRAQVDFAQAPDQIRFPPPLITTPGFAGYVSGGLGRVVTDVADHSHLQDYRPMFPDTDVLSADCVGTFGISELPTAGEVTHGFAFIAASGWSYFTEVVHRPGVMTVQAGQVMYPFPDTGQESLVFKTTLANRHVPWPLEGELYVLRSKVVLDPATGFARFKTRIWRAGDPEPATWFQNVVGNFPDLCVPGSIGVQFSQGSKESDPHEHLVQFLTLEA